MRTFEEELTTNILPFWINKMQDNQNGGFYGRIDGENKLHAKASKSAILNARILWTFSAAFRLFQDKQYMEMAQRAFEYIVNYFIDSEYGGVFWELDDQGIPINTKKQTYAQGFMLYAFSEFYRATENANALQLAKDFFYLIEEKSRDKQFGGYFEAFTRDWKPIDDVRLSNKDANEVKTMNTHLHILEPYTSLLRVWKNEELVAAQSQLINIFTTKILNTETFHLNLFFDENWIIKSKTISYGHDIEAAWLLYEAAKVLGDQQIFNEIEVLSMKIIKAASMGLNEDGSMSYEKEEDSIDQERHWWVQAEAVVGFMYAYEISGDETCKEKAMSVWEYIKINLIDSENGEWYWSRLPDGNINRTGDKAGFWKCPYHNGRMCMEMIEMFNYVTRLSTPPDKKLKLS